MCDDTSGSLVKNRQVLYVGIAETLRISPTFKTLNAVDVWVSLNDCPTENGVSSSAVNAYSASGKNEPVANVATLVEPL